MLTWTIALLSPEFSAGGWTSIGVQGVRYLTDTAENQGAFAYVPGFHHKIEGWLDKLPEDSTPQ